MCFRLAHQNKDKKKIKGSKKWFIKFASPNFSRLLKIYPIIDFG